MQGMTGLFGKGSPQTQNEEESETQDQHMILGRYRVMGEAGAGGYGTVEIAWDTRIQRRVAVKCIKLDNVNPVQLEQLQHDNTHWEGIPGLEEARTAALLSHPNIVTVFDYAVEGEYAYLVMEYVDGLTLSQMLDAAGDSMTLDMVTAVFDDVSSALEFAHENQVLHLDIKPDNVLIDHKGQAKVTDFGLSSLSNTTGHKAATGGTIGYMPPEQVRLEELDDRCDEWALASVTYEMISGSNPFQVRSLSKAAEAVEDAEIALPSLCMEGLPEAADDVLFYALDPDRTERYDSVADFAEELQKFLGNANKGHKQLAAIVEGSCEDDPEQDSKGKIEVAMPNINFKSPKAEAIVYRLWAAAAAAALGYAALSGSAAADSWQSPAYLGGYAAAIIACLILPHVGIGLTLVGLGVTLFINGALVPGSILVVAAGAWWWSYARESNYCSCAAVTPALAGLVGFANVTPLLVGLYGDRRQALAGSVISLLLAFILAGFGSASILGWQMGVGSSSGAAFFNVLLGMLSDLSFWVLVAGWLLTGMVTALIAGKGTRMWAIVAVSAGFIILAAACVGATLVATNAESAVPGPNVIGALVGCLAVGLIMAFVKYPE